MLAWDSRDCEAQFLHFYIEEYPQYEQQLQQTIMSGVRNVYGPIIICMVLLANFGVFSVHFYLTERNHEEEHMPDNLGEDSFLYGSFVLLILGICGILTPFIKNPKLR